MATERRTKMDGKHGKYMVVLYTRPCDCGGNCLYCIKETTVTRSVVPNEDTLLAANNDWSPTAQLRLRCESEGIRLGSGNKFEFRIKGNSFTNYPPEYLEQYIKSLYDMLNDEESTTIEEAFVKQDSAKDKCVQIVIETRPDQITREWCERMLRWGVRTVEIGVQSTDDEVLNINRRGHTQKAVLEATQLIREYGFDLGYQVMLGLYGSNPQKDAEMLTKTLWREEYYPDWLKIYPCLLLPNRGAQAPLYALFDSGEWKPIADNEYLEFLKSVVGYFPYDVYVNRLQRIFREDEIAYGPKKPIDRAAEHGSISHSMWHRSFQNHLDEIVDSDQYTFSRYEHGNEICIQALNPNNIILGYIRLGIRDDYSVIRDIRVWGTPLKIGQAPTGSRYDVQHKGIGIALLKEAETISRKYDKHRIMLHTSAGCRTYFKKFGYEEKTYFEFEKKL